MIANLAKMKEILCDYLQSITRRVRKYIFKINVDNVILYNVINIYLKIIGEFNDRRVK